MAKKGVLAIIPARGGSKGIPRKNVRFLAGRPLIAYSVENALNARFIDRVVVSTDDEEIAHVAEVAGSKVIMRPSRFALDEVPLDPVINHAVSTIEAIDECQYELVVTLQPTSPLLSSKTIDEAIERFQNTEVDTLLSAVDDRHLTWTLEDGSYVPEYEKRVNRQFLPPSFKETGGILITKRECVTDKSRFGEVIDLFELDPAQAVDIDGYMDWWIAEKLLTRKRILLRVDGYREIGLGHIYRLLMLAGRLIDHDILFVSDKKHALGVDQVKNSFYPIKIFESDEELFSIIDKFEPDIIINDILDTGVSYVKKLKDKDLFVVNFEDMGKGAFACDLVINALYEEESPKEHFHWGQKYYCLREEFLLLEPKKIEPEMKEVLITFGGTDSSDYTSRVLKIVAGHKVRDLRIKVVTGLGYNNFERLDKLSKGLGADIEIIQNTKTISKLMRSADMVFTSAGRTVFEVASIGTPVIVLAQNSRELLHTFAQEQNGIINLGLGSDVTDEEIGENFISLMENFEKRLECSEKMLASDLRSGIENVLGLIFDKYEQSRKRETK